MGRKTFDSIGRVLPGRTTCVLTRDATWSHEGVQVYHDTQSIVEDMSSKSAFVVGGAQIYQQLLPFCDRLYLTRVYSQVVGDTSVRIPLDEWRCLFVQRVAAGSRDSVPSEFSIWQRLAYNVRGPK